MWSSLFYRDIEKKIKSLSTWYQNKGTNYTLETKVTEARIENVGGNIWRSLFYRDIENKFKSQ